MAIFTVNNCSANPHKFIAYTSNKVYAGHARRLNVKYITRRTLIALALVVFSQLAQAQLTPAYLFKFDKVNTGDKPFDQSALCVTQDAIGFMWFGTSKGLYRYDGNTMAPIEFADFKEFEIDHLLTDSNNIWISTAWAQLYKYDERHNALTHYIYDSASFGSSVSSIASLCKAKNNTLWLATKQGVLSLNTATGKFTRHNNLPAAAICLFKDTIWAGTEGAGMQCFDAITGRQLQTPNRWDMLNTTLFSITCLYPDKSGRLWAGTSAGLFVQTPGMQVRKFMAGNSWSSLPSNYINGVLQDKDDAFTWIATANGIALYEDAKDGFVPFINNGDVNYSAITEAGDNSLFKDVSGKIWVGTRNAGIYSFYPRKIKVYRHSNAAATSIHNNYVKRIFALRNSLLAAVYADGIDVINTQNGLCTFYPFKNPINPQVNIIQFPSQRDDESIFVGSFTGLFVFNALTGQYMQPLPEKHNRNIEKVNTAIYDKQHNLWIGCEDGGLYEYLPAKDSLLQFITNKRNLRTDNVNQLDIDAEGNIVVSNYGGIQKYNAQKDSFYYLQKDKEDFSPSAGMCFLDGADGTGLAGTYQQGIFLVDRQAAIKGNIDDKGGLSSNTILSMLKGKQNTVWVTTTWGINRIDFTNNSFSSKYSISSFDHTDGLPGEIVLNMVDMNVNGTSTWYLATNDGLAEVPSENFERNNKKPPVVITGLEVSGRLISPLDSSHILSVPVYLTRRIKLDYTQNNIELTFAALNYINGQKNQYAYMLKDVDKNWVYTKNNNTISYSGLAPGEYTFLVKASNDAGVWNEVPAQLTILIKPPFWQTFWAYLLYVITAAAVIFGIYRNRINTYKRKQEKELRTMIATQEEERKRISRDLHDDIGTKLSALKLFVSTFKNNLQKKQYDETELLAQNTEQLIDETIKDVREMLVSLSPGILEEFGYTTAVEGLVNKINETKAIQIKLVIFGLKQRMARDYELALYRITQELVNNILKHAEAKNVSLQVGYRDGNIILMIEDDGKGFNVDAHREGYGLKNMEARTKLLKGAMKIDSQPGRGTSLSIEIPYQF